MTRTYHITYPLVIAVEADDQDEAMDLIQDLKEETLKGLPVGVRIGSPRHAVKPTHR